MSYCGLTGLFFCNLLLVECLASKEWMRCSFKSHSRALRNTTIRTRKLAGFVLEPEFVPVAEIYLCPVEVVTVTMEVVLVLPLVQDETSIGPVAAAGQDVLP